MILDYFHKLNSLDEHWELEETFQTHDELNTQLFDYNVLKADVRRRLIEIADMFVESIQEDNIPIKVLDYWLLGSNAGYNYSNTSDIDVHIIVNIEDTKCNPYLLRVLYDYIKSNFNNKYLPCRRKWQRTPVFLPGESHGQRRLAGYSPWGCKESNTTQ